MLADLANNIDTTAHAGAPGIDCDITVSEYASPAPVIEVSATTEYAAMEYGSPGSSTGSVATATPANAVDNPSAAAAAACAATEAEIYNLLLARLHEPGHEATGAHSGTFPVDPPMWHETEHSAVHARTFLEAALLDLISRAAAPLACNQTGSLPAEPARKMREGSSSFMFGVNRLALELGCELQGLQREGLGKQEAGLAMELPGTFPALDDSETNQQCPRPSCGPEGGRVEGSLGRCRSQAGSGSVADLITHLRTRDARYRAALPTEFCAKTPPPPMYITLYYLVTRLPDSLASVRDHFLSLCPTELTVDLLEECLTAAVLLAVTVAPLSLRGVPLSPFSPLLLLLLLSTLLALRRSGLRLLLVGGAAAARERGARVVEGTVGEAVEAVEEAEGVAVEVGVVAGVEASVAAVGVVEAAAAVVEAVAVVVEVAAAVVLVEVQPRSVEALVVASASSSRVPVRPRRPSSFVSGTLGVGGLGVLVPALTFFAPFPDAVELPRWGDLLKKNVAIFDLDFDAILATMYAVTDSAEGDCYLSVPPDPGIEAAALGASASAAPGIGEYAALGADESALSGTAPTEPLLTFTLDSGASCSFFCDSTTLTPLSRPVVVSLADPSGGPVIAHSSTVLPCPAAPSGLLSGLHLPSFSTNLVSGADLQDAWVDQFTPRGQRLTHYTCSQTGRHLATFTRRPGSTLYTLTTASPPAAASGQVAASGQSSRYGLPSLVSGLPRSLPPLPLGPAPTCVPCVEGRQCAAPHTSEFPPTEAPLQNLHMDVWGPARVRGQGHERYFLLVVDDYSRYTTVFPLRSTEVLIVWIRGTNRQLSESFGSDLPNLRLHSDRGGEFSSDLLRAFCRAEGIRQRFTLPASPQKNGIAEPRIGMVMDIARTSMIHAAAPHFLWPFAIQYAAHQINLQPRVSLQETTPTLRWTRKVGDASVFCVWGSFVRNTSAKKLSSRAVPCVFLGFPPNAPRWQFYHPTSHHVVSSQDVTFDESVSYYLLFPYRTASPPPPSPHHSS
ncbi:unnamed protein product [Closterium sp. NIES-53]